ncbi:MAG TPA: glycosyltransferase [Mycobacteriales bacterium]|nr:glycosyltransferase [Mycobacteriales bacterium]
MTRVLHIAQPVDGGVAHVTVELAAAERDRGLDVVVASPPGWLAEECRRHSLAWQCWRATRSPGPTVASEVVALRELVRQVRPAVVHLHSSKAGLAGRLLLRGRIPTVFQPHGWSWQAGGPLVAASTLWERSASRWAAAVVCVSEAERAAGLRRGVRARYHVVPNGVDLSVFRPATAAVRRAARARLGVEPNAVVTVCVGRLVPQKGQDLLVQAWRDVRSWVPTSVLVLVGDGPHRPALEALARAEGVLDSVVFAGERADVADCYAAADVVAFPSQWGEGMSLTPLEAQASGRPVVASDVAGVRESLGDGCGEVVAPGDVAGFAAALRRRLADPGTATREGGAARRHAEAFLDARTGWAAQVALVRQLARSAGSARPAG